MHVSTFYYFISFNLVLYACDSRYGGLHCVAISGYAKGIDYYPGDRFQGLLANHSWNAVYLKGSWQLVDAHWAARYLSSGVNMHDNVVYEYDDFYFLMEPQQVCDLIVGISVLGLIIAFFDYGFITMFFGI